MHTLQKVSMYACVCVKEVTVLGVPEWGEVMIRLSYIRRFTQKGPPSLIGVGVGVVFEPRNSLR